METPEARRHFLKANLWEQWERLETDQKQGYPPPPMQKAVEQGARLLDLAPPKDLTVGGMPLLKAINRRRSRRYYSDQPLTLEEVSFLLWATQGVHSLQHGGTSNRRTAPSAGSRHPFETYLLVHRVEDLEAGVYRYLSLQHKLCLSYTDDNLPEKSRLACSSFAGEAALVFAWSCFPYRSEWRYGAIAHKMIAMDIGHVCQNLYLAAEAIHAGACAVAAYDQADMDVLLQLDGVEEFTIYTAPVGKIG